MTGNGWSAASFVLAVAAWRQIRHRAPRITLRRGDVEIRLSDGTETELRCLLAVLDEGGHSTVPATVVTDLGWW